MTVRVMSKDSELKHEATGRGATKKLAKQVIRYAHRLTSRWMHGCTDVRWKDKCFLPTPYLAFFCAIPTCVEKGAAARVVVVLFPQLAAKIKPKGLLDEVLESIQLTSKPFLGSIQLTSKPPLGQVNSPLNFTQMRPNPYYPVMKEQNLSSGGAA